MRFSLRTALKGATHRMKTIRLAMAAETTFKPDPAGSVTDLNPLDAILFLSNQDRTLFMACLSWSGGIRTVI